MTLSFPALPVTPSLAVSCATRSHVEKTLSLLRPALPRTVAVVFLSVDLFPAEAFAQFLGKYHNESIRLQHLDIRVQYGCDARNYPSVPTLCGRELRSLSLVSVPVRWSEAKFRNLTRLTLGGLDALDKPTFAELRDILEASRDTLSFLDLQGAIVDLPPTDLHAALTSPNGLLPFTDGVLGQRPEVYPASGVDGGAWPDFSGLAEFDIPRDDEQDGVTGSPFLQMDTDIDSDAELEEMEAEVAGFHAPFVADDKRLDFKNLVELRLGFIHPLEGTSILNLLGCVPSLRHFFLRDLRNKPTDKAPALCNIVLGALVFERRIPLRQLQSIELQGIFYRSTWDLSHDLLDQCTDLKSLSLLHCSGSFTTPIIVEELPTIPEPAPGATLPANPPPYMLDRMYVRSRHLHNIAAPLHGFGLAALQDGSAIHPIETLVLDTDILAPGPLPLWFVTPISEMGMARNVVVQKASCVIWRSKPLDDIAGA